MANQLKMAMVDSVLRLHAQGWSRRRIARELGLDRETVTRYVQAARAAKPANAPLGSSSPSAPSKPANAPLGSQLPGNEPKPANAPLGSGADKATLSASQEGSAVPVDPLGRASNCAPWRQVIVAKHEQGLTAQRIYQDLVSEHGFAGSYYSVRRFVRRLGTERPLPFRRLESGPGKEAQVDFGAGAWIHTADGKRRRTHVFRIVLSHSRKGYSEAVYRQTTEEFLRCLENAFWHFGGVTGELVIDNLRAAVQRADWYDPELCPKVEAFCQHYGVVILPTRPYLPRHKGKIENGIGYVKSNALRGRTFASLAEQNRHLQEWEQTVADTRVHGTTRQQVGTAFRDVERPALRPLPQERFPFFHEGQRIVHRDGHVEVAKAYYSVPPEYLGHTVWARWDGRLVRIYNARLEPIATHVQREPGRFSTQGVHVAAEKISAVERGAAWLMHRVRCLGSGATTWAEGLVRVRGVASVRVLQGLLRLAERHDVTALNEACLVATRHGEYRLRTVRILLKRQAPRQATFAFLEEHDVIRPLGDYADFVHEAWHQEARR
jgi:transposase